MHVDAVKQNFIRGKTNTGEKLVYAYQIFHGGKTGYIPIFSRGKIWYILDFPGGNLTIYPFFRGKILALRKN